MSNTDEPKDEDKTETPAVVTPPSTPKSKISMMLQELEFMSMKKGGDGLDFSKLSSQQVDKVLSIMEKNEDNGFAFHSKKLDHQAKIESERINASVINHKTNRFTIIAIIIGVITITILILFVKDTYLPMWLSFVTGIAGGYGLGRGANKADSTQDRSNTSIANVENDPE